VKRRVLIRALLSLLSIIVVFVAQPPAAHGQSRSDEIQQRLDEIERARTELARREAGVRDAIEKESVRRAVLTDELAELQSVYDDVQSRVNAASADLAQINAEIAAKKRAITYAEHVMKDRLDDLRARAVHIYKRGPVSMFDMFADIQGVADFLRRFSYVAHVVREDEREIVEVQHVKAVIVQNLAEMRTLRDKSDVQLAVVTAERDRAASVRNVVASRQSVVAGELQSSYNQLGDIAAQKAAYERETAELQSESASIAAFLRGRGSGPAQVSPKGMVWPVSGPITSGFGWREHPVFHDRRFHAGIDIGAPAASPIVAAGAGEVVFAGLKNGYGNTTIVDHGGGIATLYAHQSEIGVGVGTVVGRGTKIGAVGCTGYCTGPHLHFEVRVNGDPVDPTGWLP
jgi:murein DD-endopeptidase MepM/ murein hydrolase activator NlpD